MGGRADYVRDLLIGCKGGTHNHMPFHPSLFLYCPLSALLVAKGTCKYRL